MIAATASSSAASPSALTFKPNGSSGASNGSYAFWGNASYGGSGYSVPMLNYVRTEMFANKSTSNVPILVTSAIEGNNLSDDSWDEATAHDLMMASEQALAKLWLTDEEDEAWAHLHTLPEVL